MIEAPIPHPAEAQGNLANQIDRVLNAAPLLKNYPDLVYHIANAGGNVEENAQGVAGLHLLYHMSLATNEHVNNFYRDNEEAIVAGHKQILQAPQETISQ